MSEPGNPPTERNSSEGSLTIDELLIRLKQEPQAVRTLIAEIVAQASKEYLTIEELAKRLSLKERTIKNKMASGVFRRGIHYFSPPGMGPRFKWSAVVAWLEEREREEEKAAAQMEDGIPMARGYYLGSNGPIEKIRFPS